MKALFGVIFLWAFNFPVLQAQKLSEGKSVKIDHQQERIQDSILKTLIGMPVPDFDAKDTEGYLHRPAMYEGRVLILHFWNFWDNSFRNEIPVLNEIIEKYRPQGVEILSFMGGKIGDDEKEYLKNSPIHFPLIENAYKFADAFLNMRIWRPYLIIIDKKGRMRHFYKHHHLIKITSNINENYTKVDRPTYDFEHHIQVLLRGL